MSSQHSFSCLPSKLCSWWFSQVSAPHLLCPCAEASSALPPMGPAPERWGLGGWRCNHRQGQVHEEMTGSCWGDPGESQGSQLVAVCGGLCVPVLPAAVPALSQSTQYESLTCLSENGGMTLQANCWNNLIWGKTRVLGFTLNECLSTWYKSKSLGGEKSLLSLHSTCR